MRPAVVSQVCELDIIFNFEKAYFMLDELVLGGEVQETSKKNVLKAIAAQDLLQEVWLAVRSFTHMAYGQFCVRSPKKFREFKPDHLKFV